MTAFENIADVENAAKLHFFWEKKQLDTGYVQ